MAPFWSQVLPAAAVSNVGALAANAQFSKVTGPLAIQDKPTLMTEWEFVSINLVGETNVKAAGAEVTAGTKAQTIVQLLIGGEVVWQGSDEGEVIPTTNPFGSRIFRMSADFNNPIPFPLGRQLQLQFTTLVSIATTQIVVGVSGLTSGIQPVLPPSTIQYRVNRLSGHREL